VTHVGESDLSPTIVSQLFANRTALRVGAGVVAGLGLLPGLPKLPFLALAAGLAVASTRTPAQQPAGEEAGEQAAAALAPAPDEPEALVGQMRVEPLELHLSYDILDLIDPGRGGDLRDRVRSLRQQIAMELGIVMPFVRTRDDVTLPPATYVISVSGV